MVCNIICFFLRGRIYRLSCEIISRARNCNLGRVLWVCLDSFVVFMVFRELMLISHQKSIEQLQETLRQKLLNDDNWREKVTKMWLSAVCILFCFLKILSTCQTTSNRFLCFYAHLWFLPELPRPNMLMICVFSKILDK